MSVTLSGSVYVWYVQGPGVNPQHTKMIRNFFFHLCSLYKSVEAVPSTPYKESNIGKIVFLTVKMLYQK